MHILFPQRDSCRTISLDLPHLRSCNLLEKIKSSILLLWNWKFLKSARVDLGDPWMLVIGKKNHCNKTPHKERKNVDQWVCFCVMQRKTKDPDLWKGPGSTSLRAAFERMTVLKMLSLPALRSCGIKTIGSSPQPDHPESQQVVRRSPGRQC